MKLSRERSMISSSSSGVITVMLAVVLAVVVVVSEANSYHAGFHHHHHGVVRYRGGPHWHAGAHHGWVGHRYTRRGRFPYKRTHGKFTAGAWKRASATFYGQPDGTETRGGACGYDDTVQHGYGLQTAALSTVLFDDGKKCGACYEIKCWGSQSCKGRQSIIVTATNLCPPNYAQAADNGGWCNPPREHFDLSQPAFLQVAEYKAGIVPVIYRRIPCKKQGGIRFTITGGQYYTRVLVWNVAGAGDVRGVLVKGNTLKWTALNRDWGQMWVTGANLIGQELTFRVLTGDGRRSTSWRATSRDWQYGQTYEGKNFMA